jgi:hypothetical protein
MDGWRAGAGAELAGYPMPVPVLRKVPKAPEGREGRISA